MVPLAHLLLAACALATPLRAASIPDPAAELHRKIPASLPEEIKEPLGKNPGHELADLHEPAKQIDNELRVKPAEGIPVEVVIDDVESSVKINEVTDDDEIKRPQVDLRNPGAPQRQEHETQNPEQHSEDQLKVSTIKESIEETQLLLKQSFQDVTYNIQNWVPGNGGQTKIQQNIQSLRETFTNQIQKLNDTIQTFANPEGSKPVESNGSQRDFQMIESRLKTLEDNFNNEVQTLSLGVDIVANLRSASDDADAVKETESASSTTAASPVQPAPTNPPNFLSHWAGLFFNRTIEGVTNITSALPTLFPGTTTAQGAVQADEPAGSTSRPPWSLPSFPGLSNVQWPNFGQNGNSSSIFNLQWPNLGSYFSGQNGPLNFGNLFTTPAAVKPLASTTPAAPSDQPSESKPETESDKPVEAAVSAQVQPVQPATAQPVGPIRQFLNNNPLTQGIVATVQRVQNSITNSETPRVPVEKSDSLTKGGWYGRPGNPGGSGDNNDSGLRAQKEEAKEPIQEESKTEAEFVEETKPEVVSEKTE